MACILVVCMINNVIFELVITWEIITTIANISIGFTAHLLHLLVVVSFCSVLFRFSVYLRVEFSIFGQILPSFVQKIENVIDVSVHTIYWVVQCMVNHGHDASMADFLSLPLCSRDWDKAQLCRFWRS